MGDHFQPPEKLLELGRKLNPDSFWELVEQLNPDEVLIGYYRRPEAFKRASCPWLFDESEMEKYEEFVRQGPDTLIGYFAVPEEVAREHGMLLDTYLA